MKYLFAGLIISCICTSGLASIHHSNTLACHGKLLSLESSFSQDGDTELNSSIKGTNLKEGRDFKVALRSVSKDSINYSKVECRDEKGTYLGDLRSSIVTYTQAVKISFSKSTSIPAHLRSLTVTDTLSCIEKFDETADECP